MPRKKKEEETVAEEVVETTEEETVEAGTEEVAEETPEETPEETDGVELESGEADVTVMGLYVNGVATRTFNSVTHGENFKEIAENHAKRVAEEKPTATVEAKPYIDESEPVEEKTSVKIVNANGNLVRTFAKSVHGDNYAELADAFLEKHGANKGLRKG